MIRISKVLSGAWSFTSEIDLFSGMTLPQPGSDIAFFWEDERLIPPVQKRFGGVAQSIQEAGRPGATNGPSLVTIQASGYTSYATRKIVAKLYTLPIGGAPGIIMFDLAGMLSVFGVTKPGDAGPSIILGDQLFHYITIAEAANRIKDQSPGWDWLIDDNKVFQFFDSSPGAENAPFTIRDGDSNHESLTVTRSIGKFRNKQWVLPSADLIALKTESSTAVAGQINFKTTYELTATPVVRVNGADQRVTTLGFWDGSPWYYAPNGDGVFRSPGAPALSGGETVDILYPNPFPVGVSAQDDASIAAVGLYEAVYQAKNVVDLDTAQKMAEGLLALYSGPDAFETRVQYVYDSKHQPEWLAPGMVQSIEKTFPTVSGLFTVEQVDSVLEGGKGKAGLWRHTVTLRAGLGDVTDARAAEAIFLTPARVPIVSPPTRLEFELDLTNLGQSTGLQPNRQIVKLNPGVKSVGIASWDWYFPADPPTGSDYIVDILLSTDGGSSYNSLFPSGDANKINYPAGTTAVISGIKFATDNLRLGDGAILAVNVIQVGSSSPGKYSLGHLNLIV